MYKYYRCLLVAVLCILIVIMNTWEVWAIDCEGDVIHSENEDDDKDTIESELFRIPRAIDVEASRVSSAAIELRWEITEDVDGVLIYRAVEGLDDFEEIAKCSSDTNQYIDKDLQYGKIYSYYITAYNKYNKEIEESEIGNVVSVSLKTDNVKLSKVSSSAKGVLVQWKKIAFADGYLIYRKETAGSWKQIGRTGKDRLYYTDATAKTGTTYSYTVKAYYGDIQSDSDQKGLSITYIQTPVLSSVKNQKAAILIEWKKIDGTDGYYLYRKTQNGSWKKLATIKKGATVSYQDTSAKAGVQYEYAVKAYVGKNASELSDSKGIKRLEVPVLSKVSNTSKGVKISWKKTSGGDGYYIYRKTTGGSWKKIGTIKKGNTLSFTDPSAKSGTAYLYTVKAFSGKSESYYNTAGLKSLFLSNVKAVVSNSSKGVKITWNKASGAKEYCVYRKASDGKWRQIANTSGRSYYDAAAINGKKYQYKVIACNGKNTSSCTESGSIKVNIPIVDITILLENAMKPVGTTLYVWGGGWNTADTAAGETALYKGVYPKWKSYYKENRAGYSYLPGQRSWFNGNRSWRYYGLDCSGFVGWTLYNSITEANRNKGGYVFTSTIVASKLASFGYGTSKKCSPSGTYKPGDVISINGHVMLCLGQCKDGSVLLVHSTPDGGVQLSGTVKSGASSSEAYRLAVQYMKKHHSDWWKYFGYKGTQWAGATQHLTGIRFTWKSDSRIADSAKLRNMSANQVLKYLESVR